MRRRGGVGNQAGAAAHNLPAWSVALTTIDPSRLAPAQWAAIANAVTYLVLFAAFVVAAALAFVLGHAILPSYASSAGPLPSPTRIARPALYAVTAVGLLLAVWSLAQALRLAGSVITQYYPRFVI